MSTVPDDEIRAILAKALAHDHPRRRTLHTREVDRVLLEEHKARGRASSKPAHAEGSKTEDGRTDWVIAARLISNQNQIEFRDQYAGTSWVLVFATP